MRISDWSSDVCSSDLAPASVAAKCSRASRLSRTLAQASTNRSMSSRVCGGCMMAVSIKSPDCSRSQVGHSPRARSEEHTSELQSLMRISYAVFCLKKKKTTHNKQNKRATTKNITNNTNEYKQ